jgi:hypothetical protein
MTYTLPAYLVRVIHELAGVAANTLRENAWHDAIWREIQEQAPPRYPNDYLVDRRPVAISEKAANRLVFWAEWRGQDVFSRSSWGGEETANNYFSSAIEEFRLRLKLQGKGGES